MILSDGPFSETHSCKMTFTVKLQRYLWFYLEIIAIFVILPWNYRDICDFNREITAKFTIFTAKLPRNLRFLPRNLVIWFVAANLTKFRSILRNFVKFAATNQITKFRGKNRKFRGNFAVKIVNFAVISRLKSQISR